MSQTELDHPAQDLEEMGPIDYVVLGWVGPAPSGDDVVPLIVDLVDRGLIRVLDIAFARKDASGKVTALDLEHLGPGSPFAVFEGASSGLIGFEDIEDAGAAMDPGSSAAILIWENRWAAPVATALRRSGGLLLDSGRIPVQGILAALDALEAAEKS